MDCERTFFLIVATVTLASCRSPPLLSAFNESETLRTNEGLSQTKSPPDYIQLYKSPLVHWNDKARMKRSPWGGWGQSCGGNCGGCGDSGCGTQTKVIYVPVVTQKQNNCGGGGCGWAPPPPPPPPRNNCGGGGCSWSAPSPPKKSCGGGCCSGSCGGGGGGQQTGSYSTSFSSASASAYSSSSSSSGGYGGGWGKK